jgi:hypothetical protein
MRINLNTTMHRVTPMATEGDLDAREAERQTMTYRERCGHHLVHLTAIASLFALGVMAMCGWLPGGMQ